MKRKDGQPKAKALRRMPQFEHGFKDSPTAHTLGFHDLREPTYSVLSFFSGCGGLDLGFHGGFASLGQQFSRTRFSIIGALDYDKDCVDCYRLNIGDSEQADLSSIDHKSLPRADVLLGGFPCQDFSSSGTKIGTSSSRGQLYKALTRYAEVHRPRLVVGENVPLLDKLHGGVYLKEIRQGFAEIGYSLNVWKIVCQDYGLPQSRTRLFLVAHEMDSPKPPPPTLSKRVLTIDQALADLECVVDESVPNQSQYFVADVASGGGGQGDHTNKPGSFAYTIRANARARIQFHYALPRRLTVRECARLQGFPDEFVFQFSAMRNMKLIGNAVPPTIAHQVAIHIQNFLDGEPPTSATGKECETQLSLCY